MAEHESIIYELQVRGAGAAGSAVDALNRRFATLGQNLRMTSQAAAQAAMGARLPFYQKSGRTMLGGISHLPASIKAIYKDAGAPGIQLSHRIGFASASDALATRAKLRDADNKRVGAQIAHYMMDRGSNLMWSSLSDPYQAERDANGRHLSEEHIKALRILNRERREQSIRERASKRDLDRMKYDGTTEIVPYVDKITEAEALERKQRELAEEQDRKQRELTKAKARSKEDHARALRILNHSKFEAEQRRLEALRSANRIGTHTESELQRSVNGKPAKRESPNFETSTAIVPYVDWIGEAKARADINEVKARKERAFAEAQARWAEKRREILMESKQRRKDIILGLAKWAAGPKMTRLLSAAGLGGNLGAVAGAVGLRALKGLLWDIPSHVFDRDMKTYVTASRAGVSAGEASALGWASRVYGGDAKSASALLGNIVGDTQGALVGRGLGRLGDAALRYGLDITGSGMGGLATRKELLPRIANLLAEMNDQQKKGLADTLGLQEAEFMLLKDGWDNAKMRIDEANKNNPFNDPIYLKTMEDFEKSKTDFQTQLEKTGSEFAKGYGGLATGFMDAGTGLMKGLSYIPKADAWLTEKWWTGMSGAWVPDLWDQSKIFFSETLPDYISEGTKWVDKRVGDMFPEGWGATPDTNVEHLRFPNVDTGSYYNAPSMTVQPTFNNTFNVNGSLDQDAIPELDNSFKNSINPFMNFYGIPQTYLSSPTR